MLRDLSKVGSGVSHKKRMSLPPVLQLPLQLSPDQLGPRGETHNALDHLLQAMLPGGVLYPSNQSAPTSSQNQLVQSPLTAMRQNLVSNATGSDIVGAESLNSIPSKLAMWKQWFTTLTGEFVKSLR